MLLALSFLQWWYSRGWAIYFEGFRARIRNSADFFSIGLLLRTLFQPFRQISANESDENRSIDVHFQVIIDKLISRFIGAIVRICIIFAGIVLMTIQIVGGLALGILWPFIPLLPIAGIVVSSMRVVF